MLIKKKRNIVKDAETSIPKPKPSKAVSEEQPEKETPKIVLFDLADFSKEKIADAEALGIPITKIANTMNAYAQSVETRFEIIAQNMPTPDQIQEAMGKAIVNAQTKQREEYAKAVADGKIPQGQGGGQGIGLNQILQLLGSGGGGGMDEQMKTRYNKMMDMQFNRLEADVSFTRTMENYVKSKFAGKMAAEISKDLTE